MDIEKIFLGGSKSVWAPIVLEQIQSRSGFETEHAKTFLFSSQMEGFTATFRDMLLHLTV